MLFNMDRVSMTDSQLRAKLKENLNRAFVLFEQYFPAFNMIDMGEKRANVLFGADKVKNYSDHPHIDGYINDENLKKGDFD